MTRVYRDTSSRDRVWDFGVSEYFAVVTVLSVVSAWLAGAI